MSDYLPEPGDLPLHFGPYRVLRRLGKGGMGAVYLADDPRLDRRIAIKVPFLHGIHDALILQRFRQEAQALARLHHPNLCTVYEIGEQESWHYLTMRYIDGKSLRKHVKEYRGRKAVALVATLARAMAVVHAGGVVHRDLKPDNIILDALGQPVIVDFGLALRQDDAGGRLSEGGAVQGTLRYMPPEQQRGDLNLIGPRSDVFSLGVILYELLAGQPPFQGAFLAMLEQKTAERFEPLRTFGVDAALVAHCHQALRAEPSIRFASMTEFAERLTAYLNNDDAAVETVTLAASAASREADPTTTLSPYDPRIADEVLQLLRDWGWDEGLARLEVRLETLPDAQSRGIQRLLAGWIKGQQGAHAAGLEQFALAEQVPELKAWAVAGQAFIRFREGKSDEAWKLLDTAQAGAASDQMLAATLHHGRGAIRYRQGRDDDAVEHLYQAAELFGPQHFGFNRVLDTLAMVYATRDNFPAALALFQKALQGKQEHGDLLGQALTHGQLGRLLLDWGELERAEKEFRADLAFCQRTNDSRGEAQMYNYLGQVLLTRDQPCKALDYLNESVQRNEAGGWAANEAYARKDRARALLALNRLADAEADARRAEHLAGEHAEVAFHARRALALVQAAQGKPAEAESLLRRAAGFFQDQKEAAEAARTFLELAQVQRAGQRAAVVVVESLRSALEQADRSRRDLLVSAIERTLADVDKEECYLRAYHRARGAGIPEDIGSLSEVHGEKATILFLDLRNFSGFSLMHDPRAVQITLNQIFTSLTAVVERYDIVINQYLGDGFMALVREGDHARRAVAGALAMQAAVAAFNRPRRLLGGLPLLEARIGIATGDVIFSNIGTYRKIDFTAVGPTTNLAARLQSEAQPGAVCVSEETYKRMGTEFLVADEAGRVTTLKNMGEARVWDVCADKKPSGNTIRSDL